ncbi:MAG: aldehyde dehydrogenase family protein [Deltaproteobacteria bacterium]|nr:aldehyde dehydrogenase family protein [Deltaproteobacteria bacterium]
MEPAKKVAGERKELFIDGQWVKPATGQYFTPINPATEEGITEVPLAGERETDLAVTAARRAFEEGPWSTIKPLERGKKIFRIAEVMEQQAEELSLIESLDTGKPLSFTRTRDVPFAIDLLRYYAGWANKVYGTTLPTDETALACTVREPVGVVAIITPWNSPLILSLMKIAPALAMGNTLIHKPASWTPLSALKFAEICQAAELPEGVYNVITGPGDTVGTRLVTHSDVNKVSFTGETVTGKVIMEKAAGTLKRVSLELGGKSPHIVFADGDLEAAATFAAKGFCLNQGQICWAGSRLFVDEKVHEQFLDKLLRHVREDWTVGDPMDANTRVGPLISRSHLQQVLGYIEDGKKEGAKLILGGDRPPMKKGYYLNPTVFDQVDNRMKIAREEIFGPVLAVIPFKEFGEVIEKANDSFYGLAAGIWTKDMKKGYQAARRLKAGSVWINCYGALDIMAPFGGFKQSGFGREFGQEVLPLFTETKTVWFQM